MSHRFETDDRDFALLHDEILLKFLSRGQPVKAKSWQSLNISDRPEMQPIELLDATVRFRLHTQSEELVAQVQPNLPWAEDHFMERVSGQPLNPPPSEAWWPYNRQNQIFKADEKFSHSYPERLWPKQAGEISPYSIAYNPEGNRGIRFAYGDLGDVVEQLRQDPATRQAFVPIWFPEDTGAVHGERVPCTIGYHMIQRDEMLNCVYYIRSCDFRRHFRDDVYMAGRLVQWMCDQLGWIPGHLTMHITSFHIFAGDVPLMKKEMKL